MFGDKKKVFTRVGNHSPVSGRKDRKGLNLSGLRNAAGWILRILFAFAIALSVAALPFEVFSEKGFVRYRKLKKELAGLKERNDRLAGEIKNMEGEIRDLRDDDFTLERTARDELGMIRDGEFVFIVEDRDRP